MAPSKVEGTHFSPDTGAFIELLHRHGVRYLIVGGEAVIHYGHSRLTGDVDFFYASEVENLERLFAALREFWYGEVPGLTGPRDLATPNAIFQFGVPPNRIDLLNRIDGVGFDEAWTVRDEAKLVRDGREVPLPFIGLDALIKNKDSSARPKDLDDLAFLRRARALHQE